LKVELEFELAVYSTSYAISLLMAAGAYRVVTLYSQLKRDLLTIAKYFVITCTVYDVAWLMIIIYLAVTRYYFLVASCLFVTLFNHLTKTAEQYGDWNNCQSLSNKKWIFTVSIIDILPIIIYYL